MATMTAGIRDVLVGIYVGMFKATPGLNNLNDMVADYENGMTQKQIAADLAMSADFTSVYPTAMLNSEFADELVDYLLGAGTSLIGSSDKSWATNWVLTKLNAGVARSEVIVMAVNALKFATNSVYFGAKDQLENRIEVSKYYALDQELSSTDLSEKQGVILNVTNDDATVTTAKDGVDDKAADAAGQTYTLTVGIDAVSGGIGNDKINGQLGGTATLTALDDLNGGEGDDTLNIFDIAGGSGLPGGLGLSSIEQVNVTSAGAVALNVSTYTDVTGISVLKSTGAVGLTAAGTQTVVATGVVGTTTIAGGASQTVGTAGGFLLSGSKGAVKVTDTAQAAVASTVDGGTDIDVTTTTASTGTLTIGATAVPTGMVKAVQNLAGTAALAGGAIGVKGGTSVDVTVNASNVNGATTTIGAIGVDGNGTATSVTVTQTAAVAAVATAAAVAAVTQVSTITFTALAASAVATVGGLTFTAGAAGTTAAQTAAAFANLATGATHGASTLGAYSGAYTATYASGAVSTATVTFTQNAAGVAAALATDGVGALAPATVTAGAAAVAAAGKAGVVNGAVTIIDGGATDKIASVTLKEYASNAAITSDALTSLSLTNSGVGTATVTNTKATTLALTADKVAAGVNIGGVYTTVNATATGADSTFSLTAGAVTTLTVAGDKLLDIKGAALGALKTVTVTGSAGLSLNAGDAGTITSVDTSGTTGTVTTTIDGTKATYTGGAGKDVVTLSTVAPTKAISLGAGDDTLTLAAGTVSSTGTITGGDGSDTLGMAAADAATADDTAVFATKVSGFEVLSVTAAAGQTVDVEVLGASFTGVTTNNAGNLTVNNLASGATLTVTAAGAFVNTVGIKSAATGTADVLNIALTAKGDVGGVTVANVETVNISSGGAAPAGTNTVDLIAAAATKVVVTGSSGLVLDVTGSTKLTTIDGSAATGVLTVTAVATTATTITGGSANDVLTASATGKADVLIGGAGNDTLTSNSGLSTLTGGAGNDTFVIVAPANVNSYTTITDAAAGDKIDFTNAAGVETFVASAVTLAPTAVFQDYANAAVNSLTAVGNIAWFQYGGDTYVVQQQGAFTALSDFENGTDVIVKLTGLKDLSTASLNTDTATLQVF